MYNIAASLIFQENFQRKISAIDGCTDEDDVNAEEKCIVSPKLIAYLKWLIYTAAFKVPFAEQQGAIHRQFYLDSVDTFASKEDSFLQRLKEQLEIWYAMFPAGKKRGSSSRAATAQERTVGEVHRWMIPTYKMMRLLVTCLWQCWRRGLWWSMDGCFYINFSLDLNVFRIE